MNILLMLLVIGLCIGGLCGFCALVIFIKTEDKDDDE